MIFFQMNVGDENKLKELPIDSKCVVRVFTTCDKQKFVDYYAIICETEDKSIVFGYEDWHPCKEEYLPYREIYDIDIITDDDVISVHRKLQGVLYA